jgi:ribonuclease HI
MPWRRADFKGRRVWAEVDDRGAPMIAKGRVCIRYQPKAGAKIYAAGASNVAVDASAPIEALEAGEPAAPSSKTEKKVSKGSGFGKAGTRTVEQAALAAEAARKLIASLEGSVLAFTDGSCRGNPGPAGSGVALRFPDGRRLEASRSLGRATNNIAELTAIQLALELLDRAKVGRGEEIALFTDSAYAHGVLVKGWKAKANQELIEDIRDRLERYRNLELHWIAGHVGTEGNERADELANAGVEGIDAIYDG